MAFISRAYPIARRMGLRASRRSRKQIIAIILNLKNKGMAGELGRMSSVTRMAQKLSNRRALGHEALRIRRDIINKFANIKGPLLKMTGETRTYIHNVIDRTSKEGARRAARAARSKILAARQAFQDKYLTGQTNEAVKKMIRPIARRFGVPIEVDAFKAGEKVVVRELKATAAARERFYKSLPKRKVIVRDVITPGGKVSRLSERPSQSFIKKVESTGAKLNVHRETIYRVPRSRVEEARQLRKSGYMTTRLRRMSKYANFLESARERGRKLAAGIRPYPRRKPDLYSGGFSGGPAIGR